MRIVFVLLFVYFIQSICLGQVFTKDTTRLNGGKSQEIIVNENQRFFCSDNSISKFVNGTFCCGYGVINNSAQCLHDNSRYRDMELLSNGSLTGLFYHSESCVPDESVFIMLDSTGNVLVDKRFAEGLSLSDGGILQQDTLVHVYARHSLAIPQDGIVHYRYSLSGVLLDSTVKTVNFHYNGLEYIKPYGDSLMINGYEILSNGDYKWKLIITDYDLNPNYREVYSHPDLGFNYSKNYEDTNVFIFFKNNGEKGLGAIGLNSTFEKFYSPSSSADLLDFIKMNNYYLVTESTGGSSSTSGNILILTADFKLIHREMVNHNVYNSHFIKTSDSTFILYDETWSYEYSMNFDSIPGYVNGVNNLFSNNSSGLNVQVFPNPTSNSITIQYQRSQKIEVSLFTLSGVQLKQKQVFNSTETVFDLSAYPKGLYLLRIKTEQGMRTIKIVRE